MSTFVLVHGAWHGGWCWERVAARLAGGNARALTPTLAGLGERQAELSPEIGLSEHANDVVGVIDALDPSEEVVLVGHSYGGLVVRAAADLRPERVAQVVLVDGWAGPSGSSLLSLAPAWFSDGIRSAAESQGDGWRIPVPHPATVGVTEAQDVAWLRREMSEQPLRTFSDRTWLSDAITSIPGAAIYCEPKLYPFAELAEALGYELIPIEAPHDAMVVEPERLSQALLAVSQRAVA